MPNATQTPGAADRRTTGEQHLRDFLKHAGYLIYSTDPDGRLLFVNDTWMEMLGYAENDLARGLSVRDVIAPEARDTWDDAFRRVLSGEAFTQLSTVFQTRAGARLYVLGETNARMDPETRQPIATRAIFRDVTAQRETEEALRESEHRLRAAAEGSLDSVFMYHAIRDPNDASRIVDFRIIDVNATAARIANATRGELIGRTLCEAFPFMRDAAILELFVKALETNEVIEGEYKSLATRMFPAWMRVQIVPLGESSDAIAVTARDITARKQAEELKSQLIGVASHELRTPLTVIHGALQLLSAMPANATGATHKLLTMAGRNTTRLIRLVNDLLDVERIESGMARLDWQAVPVYPLLGSATDLVQHIADAASVTLRVERPAEATPVAWGDPDRVTQVLINLLSNAIKFSPRGATVTLGASVEGGYVRMWVRDRGRGIPPDKLETIFERFEQVDVSDSRAREGAGLGLAICRGIVARHDGRIWVESVVGEGSTFYFTIPVADDGSFRAEGHA